MARPHKYNIRTETVARKNTIGPKEYEIQPPSMSRKRAAKASKRNQITQPQRNNLIGSVRGSHKIVGLCVSNVGGHCAESRNIPCPCHHAPTLAYIPKTAQRIYKHVRDLPPRGPKPNTLRGSTSPSLFHFLSHALARTPLHAWAIGPEQGPVLVPLWKKHVAF
jgi:hypothetical protein